MYYHSKVIQKVIFVIFILFSFQQFEIYAVTTNIDDISGDLEHIRVQQRMPGLSALALKNGKIVGQGAAGYRRQDYPAPLLISDPVNIGSCSKWMTATLAGRLVDRKLLSWSTQVHECFPNYETFNSAFRNATLEQLLAHRAGVQQTTTFYKYHILAFVYQQGNISQIRRWVVETVLKDTPEVQPGEFLYSNPGYTVAAVMMEQVTGQDWESLIYEHIFIPLEMTSARIGPVYDESLLPKAPIGHELPVNYTKPIPRPMLHPQILHVEYALSAPSGFVACTLHDWTKFLYAHIIAENTGYLSKDTAVKLKRPYQGVDGYGLGVTVHNLAWALPGQVLVHDGDAFGHSTVFLMAPAKDLIIVAFTNSRSDEGYAGKALDGAIYAFLAKYVDDVKKSKLLDYDFIDLNHL
ncbi:unnamed protein product [Rotaria sp. Silwood2]|nr:unnamed protein product [Rotaria sp. Silwood2]CAF4266064.1 unnamed protein product [Rotaria sp. Silwood2]